MTSGQDLIIELQGRVSMLDTALKQLGNRGRAAADAEQKYRISLAQKIMVERDKGTDHVRYLPWGPSDRKTQI